MRFKPVDFGGTNCAISKLDRGHAFALSPASCPIPLSQNGKDADATPHCDSLDVGDFADDFKVHAFMLSGVLLRHTALPT